MSAQYKDLKNKNILVIDDDYSAREILKIVLADSYNIFFASTGGKGLAVVKKERIDVIILDLGLPDMDGLEVLRKIKNNPATKNIQIIINSMRDDSEIEKCLTEGAFWYLVKGSFYFVKPILNRAIKHKDMEEKLCYDKYIKPPGTTDKRKRGYILEN